MACYQRPIEKKLHFDKGQICENNIGKKIGKARERVKLACRRRLICSRRRQLSFVGSLWHLRSLLPQGNRLLLNVSVRYRAG